MCRVRGRYMASRACSSAPELSLQFEMHGWLGLHLESLVNHHGQQVQHGYNVA
jgi:hypothetical protein